MTWNVIALVLAAALDTASPRGSIGVTALPDDVSRELGLETARTYADSLRKNFGQPGVPWR